MIATAISSMCAALGANGPSQELTASADIFGWLVGAWDVEILDSEHEGMHRVNEGEWHFAWVLEGRAIQDVLIAPKLTQRRSAMPAGGNRYGTGLRVYDAKENRWRALWVNPVQAMIDLFGVEHRGGEIIETSGSTRNVFSDMTNDSFRYRIETKRLGSWKKIAEISARRTA